MPSLFSGSGASAYCNDYFSERVCFAQFSIMGSSFCISFSANVVSYIFSSSFDDGSASLSIMVPFLSYLFLYRHYFTLWTPGRSVLPEIQPGMEPFHSLLFHNRFYGIFTHFLHRLMNGRNGRIRQCGNPGIIESHNRDILRNTFSHFLHARIIFAAITSLVAKFHPDPNFFQ